MSTLEEMKEQLEANKLGLGRWKTYLKEQKSASSHWSQTVEYENSIWTLEQRIKEAQND